MTSPRPWSVVYVGEGGEREVWNIVDANGKAIVETDCGFYPPTADDAELIVAAVNGIPHCEHCQAVAADARRALAEACRLPLCMDCKKCVEHCQCMGANPGPVRSCPLSRQMRHG